MHGHAVKVHIIITQHAPGGGMWGGPELDGQKGRRERKKGDVWRRDLKRKKECQRSKKAQISLMKGLQKEQ